MAIGHNTSNAFIVSKDGSPLSQLTSGAGAGKIKFLRGDQVISAGGLAAVASGTATGIVFPLHGATIATFAGTELAHGPLNILGDPAEQRYSLTSGDLFSSAGVEKDGGAQKFVNAVLDGAYRAYTSGVAQASGLNSMTVTRGDLSLSATALNDHTGIVNTFTRSYTVNFKYYQSGTINSSGSLDPSQPDIANDTSGGVPF
jgi:hypothetical protein